MIEVIAGWRLTALWASCKARLGEQEPWAWMSSRAKAGRSSWVLLKEMLFLWIKWKLQKLKVTEETRNFGSRGTECMWGCLCSLPICFHLSCCFINTVLETLAVTQGGKLKVMECLSKKHWNKTIGSLAWGRRLLKASSRCGWTAAC